MTTSVDVLYVMGVSRSGTTLLGEILGQAPGHGFAGEVRWLWDQLRMNGRCGCGEAVASCPVWSEVATRARGDATLEAWASGVSDLRRHTVGARHSWAHGEVLRARRRLGQKDTNVERYEHELLAAYRSFLQQTGERILVDSSSEPADAELLSSMPEVNLRVVHVVRDPRGVAYSHLRAQPTRRAPSAARAAYVTASWSLSNVADARLGRRIGPERYRRVRYEDLVRSPASTLRDLCTWLEAALPEELLDDGKVALAPTHSVAGNARRFRTGAVELSEDLAWQSGLTGLDVALVRLLSAPLAGSYGYR